MLTKGLRLPAVLREEPQYRLLFGSQVLSILGDRVTSVALPFAVLATGGGVGEVALVSAAQFLPFVVLALPAGVFAGIVEIAVVGYVLIKLMAVLRRRLLIWHQEAQAPSTA